MVPDREREDDRQRPQLNRRQFLQTAVAGSAAVAMSGEASAATDDAPIEVRSTSVTYSWNTVPFEKSYASPTVIAPSLSYHDPDPASPRVRGVTADQFDLRVEEWEYLDGGHQSETVGLVTADTGTYTLADGTTIEVGQIKTDTRWTAIAFDTSFSTRPVVFSNTQTFEGYQPVVTRHRNCSPSGVEVRLQESEAGGWHREEVVSYLAVESGSGSIDGRPFEAGVESDVGSGWQTIPFDGTYDQPTFIADIQSTFGGDTATVRYRNLTSSSVDVKLEEERSNDDETWHKGERLGYLVVERPTTDGYGAGNYGASGYGE